MIRAFALLVVLLSVVSASAQRAWQDMTLASGLAGTNQIMAVQVDGTNETPVRITLDALGGSIGRYVTSMEWTNCLVVDAGRGSDTTARRGSPEFPWATIGAAQTNARAGDTIVVRAGTYVDVATNNVPGWYLETGASLFAMSASAITGWEVQGDGYMASLYCRPGTTNRVVARQVGGINVDNGAHLTIAVDEWANRETNRLAGVEAGIESPATLDVRARNVRISSVQGSDNEANDLVLKITADELTIPVENAPVTWQFGTGSRFSVGILRVRNNCQILLKPNSRLYWDVARTELGTNTLGFTQSSGLSTNLMLGVPQFDVTPSPTNRLVGAWAVVP